MKHLLSLFLLLTITAGYSQTKEPFRKANLIIIETGKTDQENYSEFGRYLVSQGYTMENSNSEFLFFKTGFIEGAKHNSIYKLNASFVGGQIRINVEWTLNAMPYKNTTNEWSYATAKSNTLYKVWEHFLPVLEGFGGEILYDKK